MISWVRLTIVTTAAVLLCLVGTLAEANGITYKLPTDRCVSDCAGASGMTFGMITFTENGAQQIEVTVTLVGQSFSSNPASTAPAAVDLDAPEYQSVSVNSVTSGWTVMSGPTPVGTSGVSSVTLELASPLSLEQFVQLSKFGSGEAYFAGDVLSVNGVPVGGVNDPGFLVGASLRTLMNPEPATLVLLGSGLLAAAFRIRKRLKMKRS
jgi:hypothetical protein